MRKLLLVPLLAAIAVIATTTLTSAHSRPVLLDPPPGTVMTDSPAEVKGRFTAELRRDPNWTFMHVTNGAGERVDTGETELTEDRLGMVATLQPDLPEGRYLVTWRTFDDEDGAIFGDCYVFFVGQAAADAALAEGARLDGGRDCQRIDVSATEGTPVAGGTPPEGEAGGHEGGGAGEGTSDGSDDGVPVWTLIAGVVVGLVAGGIGGRFLGKRA